MSTMRTSLAVCAAVLLAAGLSGQSADAEGLRAGIAGLFSSEKGTDQSYAILADHLYKATQSAELADNTKAAGSLASESQDSKVGVEQLVQAFGSLTGDSSKPESFCSKDNLAKLRRVAEGLLEGGNLRPEKITDAILRLNKIVITVIGDALEACEPYLTERWPNPWQPKFSDPAMKGRIVNLQEVAYSYLYEGYVGIAKKPSAELHLQDSTFSYVVREAEKQAVESIVPDEPYPLTTEVAAVIAIQLDEYVYKPCSEFVQFDEAKEVLEPFNDLLKSWSVVSLGLLNGYYKNKGAYKRKVKGADDMQVRHLTYSYQACQRFLTVPKEKLAKRIRRGREIDYSED